MSPMCFAACALGLCVAFAGAAAAPEPRGALAMERLAGAAWRFGGVLGDRIKANVEHWLLVAPRNNPGLLDMFANRDKGPKPNLVPWAGEFVGKFLISGVQAMRMSDDPRLRDTLAAIVRRLAELQAEDGYLGPWPKAERLLGHWDLWGHYHIIQALLLWHEQAGDEKALGVARRMADLICHTYLDTQRRVFDAGSHEMNMSVIHGLALLYEKTKEPRYLRMAEEILKDFERAGDYFRTGLAGVEFFRTPRPRWESLHAVQGLAELYRITGDERLRRAFLHHWASIRRFDVRNTGGFSSGEQATGNPFADTPIETCCVIAWQAVMMDALRLTGDPTIADDLERTTFNAVAGAQHPSGAWCTYDAPMNGRRVPSHVAINFQARPDTPHLNCCSVNGPRGFGALSEWAVMSRGDGLAVNFYGPMELQAKLADGTAVTLTQDGNYPIGDGTRLIVELPKAQAFPLALRIPAWSAKTEVLLNGKAVPEVQPGSYLELAREWRSGDTVTLRFDMGIRAEPGDLEQFGKASFYRGPILLAHDEAMAKGEGKLRPWLLTDVATTENGAIPPTCHSELIEEPFKGLPPKSIEQPAGGKGPAAKTLRLCDFASAGADGGAYRSWFPATGLRPPAPVPWLPADGARVPPGAIRFTFRKPAPAATVGGASLPRESVGGMSTSRDPRRGDTPPTTDTPPTIAGRRHTVAVSDSPDFARTILTFGDAPKPPIILPASEAKKLKPNTPYYWKLIARNAHGVTESIAPHKHFVIDPTLPPAPDTPDTQYGERPKDSALVIAPLRGDPKPEWGQLKDAKGWRPAPGPDGKPDGAIELDGAAGRITYAITEFPDHDFTVAVWLWVTALPKTQYGQVFSAWCKGMDDPLRLVVHQGKLHARIEAGQFFGTEGWPVEVGKWTRVAAVKEGAKLTLYINGAAHSTAKVPENVASSAEDFALGGNPHFGGPEFLACRLADLRFFARALAEGEVRATKQVR